MEKHKLAEKLELKDLGQKEFPKVFQAVQCPSCAAQVEADNIDLQNSLAKCGECHVIFAIDQEVERVKTRQETKQTLIRPEGIDLFYYRNELDITIQQHLQGVDIAGIIFLPFLALLFIAAYFLKGTVSVYLPILSTLGSLFFVYRVLNYSKNKDYINVNQAYLNIKSRPRHFRKDRSYDADEIDQLYIKHAADGSGYFTIHMIINGYQGQKHVKLITCNTLAKAQYLEQEIEKYLGIEDRKVAESNVT